MKYSVCIVLLAFLSAGLSAQAKLLWSDDAEQGSGKWNTILTTGDVAVQGKKSFVINPGERAFSVKKFRLDPTKKYTLRCSVKASKKTTGNFLIGLTCYGKNGKEIGSAQVHYYPGSETKLLKDVWLGDMEIFVENGSAWRENRWGYAAFFKDLSGKGMDDPMNFVLAPNGISGVEKTDSGWKITLSRPLLRDIPKGTPIREHRIHTNRNFTYILPVVPTEWKTISGSCSGVAVKGNPRSGQWWPGTVTFSVFFMSNVKAPVYVDDFKLMME